ncbi:MAG: M56 family metallopeptidase [Microbispora sp.]|nr:M56 family metallopeptidase [Microbispora sp.]
MRITVYLPLVVSALLGPAISPLGRRLPPANATRLLVAAGMACAVSSVAALALLAGTYVGQVPLVAALGDWSARLVHSLDPVPPLIGQLALLALGGVGVSTVKTLVHNGLALIRSARTCRQTRSGPGGLVVVDDPHPRACALPGGRFGVHGRILVTTGMLRALSAEDRRVLLAHERAHLRHCHHLYRAAAAVAAAMNPLLAALPRAVEYATERWSDEQAAEDVGDRRVAARAITRAALAATRYARNAAAPVMKFSDNDVPARVRNLLTAPPRHHPLLGAILVVTAVACLTAVNEACADTETIFKRALYPPAVALGAHSSPAAHSLGTPISARRRVPPAHRG